MNSAIHSNLPSHKGSFHTDDSLTDSPQQLQIQLPQLQVSLPQIEQNLSVNSRQSTIHKSAGATQGTNSIACNEGGPIGLNESANQNNAGSGGPITSEEEEEIEFLDEELDKIEMPLLHINVQTLQIMIITNLKLIKEGDGSNSGDFINDQPTLQETSVRKKSVSLVSPLQQPQQFSDDKSNGSNNSSVMLTSSITSQNLGNGSLSSAISLPGCQQNHSQGQYQTLSLEQTIWSPQIPAQTQQEFLMNKSQLVQQHHEQQQYHLQQQQNISVDIQSQLQNQLQLAQIQQHQSQQQQQIRSQELNPSAPPFIHGTQQNQALIQSSQPQQNLQTMTGHYPQSFDMIGQNQLIHLPTQSQSQALVHQQYMNPQNYPQAIGNDLAISQQANTHILLGQGTANHDQPNLNEISQMALNQILNQQQQLISHPLQSNQLMTQNLAQPNIVTQPQQMGLHLLSGNPSGLTHQDIQNAAQVEAIHQMIAATSGPSQQMIIQQQQYEQQQQQQSHNQAMMSAVQNPQLQQPTPIYSSEQSQQISQNNNLPHMMQAHGHHPNDPHNLYHYDHHTHLAHLYANRQINRYIHNPVYKTKSFKYASQLSFRGETQSPDLFFPGNLSVMRPPPGFEHVIPRSIPMNPQNQLIMEVAQNQLNQQLQHNALQELALQQQQTIQNQQAAANQAAVQQQIQQQLLQQQHQQNQQQQQLAFMNRPHSPQYQNNPYYFNSMFAHHLPHNQVYTSFFGEQIRTKQSELDEQLRKTTQQLDHKLMENLELQEQFTDEQNNVQQDDENSNMYQSEQQNMHHHQTLPLQSIEQINFQPHQTNGSSSSSLCSKDEDKMRSEPALEQPQMSQDEQLLFSKKLKQNSFKEGKEQKERIELFKKLRNQLNKIKNELFSQNDQSISPKQLTPFRLDPSKYLEKILNLMTIINEVESNTNIAELKSEYEKTKSQLEKMRAEKQKFFSELSQVTIHYHELENNHQTLLMENKSSKEQYMKEREQLDLILKMSNEQIRQLSEIKDSLQVRINELLIQLDMESKKKGEFPLSHKSAKEHEKVKQIKAEYGKKLTDYQVEINDLREYIKKRSQEDQQKRQEDKKIFDGEMMHMKESYDTLKKQSDLIVKERDTEIRILSDNIQSFDPEFFKNSRPNGTEKIECPDCKRKDCKNQDLESRIKDLTDYIKKNSDRLGSDRGKYEDEIARLKSQCQEQQSTLEQLNERYAKVQQDIEMKQPPIILFVTPKLVGKLTLLLDKINGFAKDSFSAANRISLSDLYQNQTDLLSAYSSKNISKVEESKVDLQDASIPKYQSKPHADPTLDDVVTEFVAYLKSEADRNCHEPLMIPISKSEKEQLLLEKIGCGKELTESYRDIIKDGRNERKVCHQVIVEVEKLMYKLNSMLITEQMNLEEDLKSKPSSPHLGGNAQRQEFNMKLRELFGKILETYLELPHKLKPIFDRLKNNEQTFSKFYKADPQLLYDLTSVIVDQYRYKNDGLNDQLRMCEDRYFECQQQLNRQVEDNDKQRQKIIALNEKIVQINSAYNALQKHLYSGNKGQSASNLMSTPSQMHITPQQHQAANHSFSSQSSIHADPQYKRRSIVEGNVHHNQQYNMVGSMLDSNNSLDSSYTSDNGSFMGHHDKSHR